VWLFFTMNFPGMPGGAGAGAGAGAGGFDPNDPNIKRVGLDPSFVQPALLCLCKSSRGEIQRAPLTLRRSYKG